MAKRNLTHIKVVTLPNGYGLKVGSQDYMSHDETEFVEQVIYHIGLKLENYASHETIRDILTACATWPDAKDAIKAMAKVQEENTRLRNKNAVMGKTIERLEKRIEALEAGVPDEKKKSDKHIHRCDIEDRPLPMCKRRVKFNL